jgi:hypothetical protein
MEVNPIAATVEQAISAHTLDHIGESGDSTTSAAG